MTADLHAHLLDLADRSTPEGRAVVAVLGWHTPAPDGEVCDECADPGNPYVAVPWPCPTVQAIAEQLDSTVIELREGTRVAWSDDTRRRYGVAEHHLGVFEGNGHPDNWLIRTDGGPAIVSASELTITAVLRASAS